MCSGRLYGSTDMKNIFFSVRPLWSWPGVKFSKWPLKVKWYVVHSTRLGERNMMLEKAMSWLSWVKSYIIYFFCKNNYFLSFYPLEAKPLTWSQIWHEYTERPWTWLWNALFRDAVAFLVYELDIDSFQNCWYGQKLTFDDLWWPELWPDVT